jgi:hypothetical protein
MKLIFFSMAVIVSAIIAGISNIVHTRKVRLRMDREFEADQKEKALKPGNIFEKPTEEELLRSQRLDNL